jgi:hypothetical protein
MEALTSPESIGTSPADLEARSDFSEASLIQTVGRFGKIAVEARHGIRNVWLVATVDGRDALALRAGYSTSDLEHVECVAGANGSLVLEFASSLGAMRAKIAVANADLGIVRCTTTLLPASDVLVSGWPNDLYPVEPEQGTIHTSQRGLRTGIVFASCGLPTPFSFFYIQDFSSLNDFFAAVKRSPADCVSGRWPELGYAPPGGEGCVLRRAREFVVSDAYLTLVERVPASDAEAAALYLDMLADTYLCLPRPEPEYHDWPMRAERALRDLSVSPECTTTKHGLRYLKPYVSDDTKPPESMVQLTLASNVHEYERWAERATVLSATLHATVPSFFDEGVGSIVRWLPTAQFDDSQAEQNMNHSAMDSWYLHHALFNTWRVADECASNEAKRLFKASLPFVMRVARRFAYRWPIFFDLRSLDVIRAESEPGKGGETDVGGIYALVMLHAYDMFGDAEYLEEAKKGVESLRGLGFTLGYQLNTTGFAAEAALRLWKLTGERSYLELGEICLANVFDNMWLWQCTYGNARHYRNFFGLFPLRKAPYTAPYEEMEAQAKCFELLANGDGDLRPSLRLLLTEYQKYNLDRAWYYYPDALPVDVVEDEPRNGRILRGLSVPLEDLQDGFEKSGQVGQEIYGAGLPFVFTSRHYARVPGAAYLLYCNYPASAFSSKRTAGGMNATWRIAGDPRGTCQVRVVPIEANMAPAAVTVTTMAGSVRVPLAGTITPEGHAAFTLRGGLDIEVDILGQIRSAAEHSVVIGAPAAANV